MERKMDNYVKGEGQKEEEKDLTPWEQHATVINLPRFNYQAPNAFLERSQSGFLITCTMKREKSATKEAINILEKYFKLATCASRDKLGFPVLHDVVEKSQKADTPEEIAGKEAVDAAENVKSKRRKKIGDGEELKNCSKFASDATHEFDIAFDCSASEISSHNEPNRVTEREQAIKLTSFKEEEILLDKISNSRRGDRLESFAAKPVMISLVKLARNGLLFFSLPENHLLNIVTVVSKIFQAMASGEIKPPLWCHRILPVQATCLLKKEDLHSMVLKLVKEHIGDTEWKAEKPLKFAVGCNRRGVEGHEVGTGNSQKDLAVESTVLDRNDCISVVAGTVKEVVTHSVVDLQSPKMAVLVEVLPLTGVHAPCVAAVAVLPGDLVNAKPRLSVRPLVSDSSNKRKHS